ncbi:MAG: hypothetical protein JNN12_05650, partial [Bacteroidetes Order II. Incertae sedis bacterium]|nr:hypothetical protein [Bacteroidetes Order II. bacterium]MBL7977807.1 hypothetical protein [Bacteroidetes Order II. bacterium]
VAAGVGHHMRIDSGSYWASGTYLVVLTAQQGNQTLVQRSKIVLLK